MILIINSLIIILFVHCIETVTQNVTKEFSVDEINPVIEIVVNSIISFFAIRTSTLAVVWHAQSKKNQQVQDDLIQSILHRVHNQIVVRMESDEGRLINRTRFDRTYNLLFVDGYESFE